MPAVYYLPCSVRNEAIEIFIIGWHTSCLLKLLQPEPHAYQTLFFEEDRSAHSKYLLNITV